MKPYGYVRKDGEGHAIFGKHQFQNPLKHELVPIYTKDAFIRVKRDEALRYANEAGLTSMLETPRIPYTDWANRILRLVELVEQHTVGAADNEGFYGLPHESASASNADGNGVTAGETAPTDVGVKR